MKTNRWGRRVTALVLTLLLFSLLMPTAMAKEQRRTLLVGGIAFGVRFATEGVMVVGYCDVESGGACHNPARAAGLMPGDCICELDGEALSSAETLAKALETGAGREITLTYRREGTQHVAKLTPARADADGRWRVGLFVRDSGAGIGTITYIEEDTGAFAGLGHGICDGESGALIPLSRGAVMGVTIASITKGAVGAPGELRGHFSAARTGTLSGNTACGVYGVLLACPTTAAGRREIAHRNEVHEGAASVWCTLDDNVSREYSVSISNVKRAERGNKCFTVKVTDKTLLEKTGGIVQGMSGSPIIQDGRLIGAVTHVLIGDPTTGYGIFIENMLENMPQALN